MTTNQKVQIPAQLQGLGIIGQVGLKQNHVAQLLLLHQLDKGIIDAFRRKTGYKHLSQLLLQGHFLYHLGSGLMALHMRFLRN